MKTMKTIALWALTIVGGISLAMMFITDMDKDFAKYQKAYNLLILCLISGLTIKYKT